MLIKAWNTDHAVFYLMDSVPVKQQQCDVWVHFKERGAGGRTIEPKFDDWADFYNRTIFLWVVNGAECVPGFISEWIY
jgi:hypothetical protein